MSYFPSPDFEKMHAPSVMFTQPHPLIQTPPQSAQPDKLVDSFVNTVNEDAHLLPDSHTSSDTNPDETCGLGLLSFSTSQTSLPYLVSAPLVQSMPVAFAWSATAYATNQLESYKQYRRDSCAWNDHCDPMSTILSNGAWHGLHGLPDNAVSGKRCDDPPSLSPYSPHSSGSAVSTPYSRCEEYANIRGAPSPMVKIEETPETTTTSESIQETYSFDRSLSHATPCDMDRHTVDAPGFQVFGTACSSGNTNEDSESTDTGFKSDPECKSDVRSSSPYEQRAGSVEDPKREFFNISMQPKRTYTTEENACFTCDDCGKHFQRSYNLRAHMDTHNPKRRHPHACRWPHCTKRFVRRTDLARHEQSVHFKTRDFTCPYCQATFARKDTMTRHCEDGCSRRLDYRSRTPRTRPPSKATRRLSVTAP